MSIIDNIKKTLGIFFLVAGIIIALVGLVLGQGSFSSPIILIGIVFLVVGIVVLNQQLQNIKKILGIVFLVEGIIIATGAVLIFSYGDLLSLPNMFFIKLYINLYILPTGIVFIVVGIILFVLGRKQKSGIILLT